MGFVTIQDALGNMLEIDITFWEERKKRKKKRRKKR